MSSIAVGDHAPELTAITHDGQKLALADFEGKSSVVVFFYPMDDSLICTQEACSFRDAYEDFVKVGAVVIGVSGNTAESHEKFATNNHLPFQLVADTDGAWRQAFGVPKSFGLLPGRVTYVIDREGIVRFIFNSQLQGLKHVDEALRIVRELNT